jgi:hypothetical protein
MVDDQELFRGSTLLAHSKTIKSTNTGYSVPGSPLDVLGWVPVDLSWDSPDAGSSLRRIAWMDCGGATFTEPFFLQTIARLRRPFEARNSITTTPDAITNRFKASFDYRPRGLIFHVSRCGSTALSNCLKLCESTQVIAEYRPLTQFHWHDLLSPVSYEREWQRALEVLAMKVGAWSLSTCRRGTEEDLVIKLTSSSLLSIDTIRAIWPQVPCVLIVRHPLEVLVASLRGGGWMDLKVDALRSAFLMGASPPEIYDCTRMSNEEYGARVVGNYMDIALTNSAKFDLIIDHSQLTGATIQEVANLFNLRAVDREAFDAELSLDAKRRDHSKYVFNRLTEQAVGSQPSRTAFEKYAIASYETLVKKLPLKP